MTLTTKKNIHHQSNKQRRTLPQNNLRPFASIIIPCYNDEIGIKTTLESLLDQSYPSNLWEVIVVNNNSLDRTEATARSFLHRFPNCIVLNELQQSSYAARNKGIQNSKGDILLFIDSDMTVNPDWISTCVEQITKLNADYLGGRVDVMSYNTNPNIFALYDILTGFPIEHYVSKYNFAGAGCLIITRHLLDKVGMFDSKLKSGGDFEFGNRVKSYGFDLCYSDRIIFNHPARSSLKSLIIKAIRVSNGIADLKTLYPDRFGKLNILFIVKSLIPILKTNIKNKQYTISFRTKGSVLLINNFINYTKAFVFINRYLRMKCHNHETRL